MNIQRSLVRSLAIILGLLYLFITPPSSASISVPEISLRISNEPNNFWESPLWAALLGGLMAIGANLLIVKYQDHIENNHENKRLIELNNIIWWAFALRVERLLYTLTIFYRGRTSFALIEIKSIYTMLESLLEKDSNNYRKYCYLRIYEILYIVSAKFNKHSTDKSYIGFISEYRNDLVNRLLWLKDGLDKSDLIENQSKIIIAYQSIVESIKIMNSLENSSNELPGSYIDDLDLLLANNNINEFEMKCRELESPIHKEGNSNIGWYLRNLKIIYTSFIQIKKSKMYIDEREIATKWVKEKYDDIFKQSRELNIYR